MTSLCGARGNLQELKRAIRLLAQNAAAAGHSAASVELSVIAKSDVRTALTCRHSWTGSATLHARAAGIKESSRDDIETRPSSSIWCNALAGTRSREHSRGAVHSTTSSTSVA